MAVTFPIVSYMSQLVLKMTVEIILYFLNSKRLE